MRLLNNFFLQNFKWLFMRTSNSKLFKAIKANSMDLCVSFKHSSKRFILLGVTAGVTSFFGKCFVYCVRDTDKTVYRTVGTGKDERSMPVYFDFLVVRYSFQQVHIWQSLVDKPLTPGIVKKL